MGPKVVVNWDNLEHLCQEVEKFPAIWDKQHPDHKKPKYIAEIWAHIDEECPEYKGTAKDQTGRGTRAIPKRNTARKENSEKWSSYQRSVGQQVATFQCL